MPGDKGATKPQYLIEAVFRACDLLEAFQLEGEQLRLRDLVERTGMNKTTAFRIITTLVKRGVVERIGADQFHSKLKPLKRAKFRLGYCSMNSQIAFSRDITEGLKRAADDQRIDLRVLDNHHSSKVAVRNAELLIREKVDLVIEHQGDEHLAAAISTKFLEAGIPMIAVHIPHPGATYFGPDNYRAGLMAGQYLGRWAKQRWEGSVEQIMLLEYRRAGLFARSWLTGTLVGIKEALPHVEDSRVTFLNGHLQLDRSLAAARKHIRRKGTGRTLICGIDDPSTIGAIRAFEETGCGANCAAVGHGAAIEGRAELRRSGSPLVATVAYFPEKYGDALIALAIQILSQRPAPPSVAHQEPRAHCGQRRPFLPCGLGGQVG